MMLEVRSFTYSSRRRKVHWTKWRTGSRAWDSNRACDVTSTFSWFLETDFTLLRLPWIFWIRWSFSIKPKVDLARKIKVFTNIENILILLNRLTLEIEINVINTIQDGSEFHFLTIWDLLEQYKFIFLIYRLILIFGISKIIQWYLL